MAKIMIYLTDELYKEIKKSHKNINFSALFREAIRIKLDSRTTKEDIIHRLQALLEELKELETVTILNVKDGPPLVFEESLAESQ